MINYLKNKYTAYKNRGFTLIELIVVMAIIAVLVLLAAPKFIEQTDTAQDTNIQNDVKVAEMKVSEALVDGVDVWESWTDDGVTDVTSDTLKTFIREDGTGTSLYGRGGPIYDKNEVEVGDYRVLPGTFIEQEIHSRLEGAFYANKNGTVYYENGVVRQGEADKKEPSQPEEPSKPGQPSEPEEPGMPVDEETRLIKEEGYIPIATAEELDNIRNATLETYGKGTDWEKEYTGGLDEKYIQVANIDLSGYSEEGWSPIGTSYESFTGIYDGNGYDITGLTINRPETDYVGLFGHTQGAIIHNVGLIGNKVTGRMHVGGLVGMATNGTTGTKISNSYATGSVTGDESVGGLVGYTLESTIENSYATGPVTGAHEWRNYNLGGLVGWASTSTTIENSYATGAVTGFSYPGGLVGKAGSSITISNSYWDKEITGRTSSAGGGEGKTTDEMKQQATYSGWDFETVWKIDEGSDYPKLR